MVIGYKLSPPTYWLGRLLVKTPFIGLPNIVAGKGIVKELIQHAASPENLAGEIVRILTDAEYRRQMQAHLQGVKTSLGQGGGSKNMALLALEMLSVSKS
jgi:lipid-A-disaccharide synthase